MWGAKALERFHSLDQLADVFRRLGRDLCEGESR